MMNKFQIGHLRLLFAKEKTQVILYAFLSLAILIGTGILMAFDPSAFMRFIGNINPLILIPTLIIGGLIILLTFISRNWFQIIRMKNLTPLAWSYGLATILASISILIDITYKYPEATNVFFPQSLLFYPVIAFVAELLFHLIPIVLLLLITKFIFKYSDRQRIYWMILLLISLIEPIYQTIWSPSYFPLWILIYLTIHLYIFNFIELYVFKQYGFLAMFSVRILYYLIWHIIWGYFRLDILF